MTRGYTWEKRPKSTFEWVEGTWGSASRLGIGLLWWPFSCVTFHTPDRVTSTSVLRQFLAWNSWLPSPAELNPPTVSLINEVCVFGPEILMVLDMTSWAIFAVPCCRRGREFTMEPSCARLTLLLNTLLRTPPPFIFYYLFFYWEKMTLYYFIESISSVLLT